MSQTKLSHSFKRYESKLINLDIYNQQNLIRYNIIRSIQIIKQKFTIPQSITCNPNTPKNFNLFHRTNIFLLIEFQQIQFDAMIQQNQAETSITTNKQASDIHSQQNPTFFVRIIQPIKKSTLADLDINNPEDRALSLILKMLQQRKLRQQKQKRLLQELRQKQIQNIEPHIGQISRIIDKQNLIGNHQYLRESLYEHKVDHMQKSKQRLSPILVKKDDQKINLKRQMQILRKSKILNIKQQKTKMVYSILQQVISKSVDLYYKKMRFFFKLPPKKISAMLPLPEYNQSNKTRKKQLNLSRVYDISIANQLTEQSLQQNISDDSQQKQDSQENSDNKQQIYSESESSAVKQKSNKQQSQNQSQSSNQSQA